MCDPRIQAAATEWTQAAHGMRSAIVERLAMQIGCTVQTAYRKLRTFTAGLRPRKQRSDAGRSTVTADEALCIATLREETRRQTGSGALPLGDVVAVGRANELFKVEKVDTGTGEAKPVSLSTVRRALRRHYLHESQLEATTPASRLSSPHPNYLWQVDASISRQFYLAEDGTRVMPRAEFYRGKPQNFARIAERRLWRYVVTDHASGCIEVFYVLGAESSANLISALIHTMTERAGGTMHGVPRYLMADPGSAVTAQTTQNFCRTLDIKLLINDVGNARAKGQVEKSHHLVEIHFEATLKLAAPVTSLEEINTLAQRWSYAYNATRIHTRTGMSRRDGWLRITRDQLIAAPSIDVLRQMPNSAPKLCTVRDCLIRYKGRVYDVRSVPGLINGSRINVVFNALDPAGSVRVLVSERGQGVQYIAPCVSQDEWGFLATAARVGEEYKSMPQTPADAARKEIERLAMQVDTDKEAAAARKAKRLAFGGRIDPLKHVTDVVIPPHVPRASTPLHVEGVNVVAHQRIEPAPVKHEFPPLDHVEAARRLKPLVERAGLAWTAEMYVQTVQRWPEGVPVDQVETWAEELVRQPHTGLRLVQGGAA